jgi:predicted phage terminase large subunit-like protein
MGAQKCASFLFGKGVGRMANDIGRKIVAAIGDECDLGAIKDALAWYKEHYEEAPLEKVRRACVQGLKKFGKEDYFECYRMGLLISAPNRFDQFMQYLEIDRKPKDRFYLPRREILLPFVNALQDLADDRLDELFLSQPPRTGKSTTAMFYMVWLMGRDTERSNLYCSFSDTITTAFYNGVLEVMTDDHTYNYAQVFPDAPIVKTDAKQETIDLGRAKRYPSFTARSLYGTLNGAVDCNGIQIADDLIGGIEEALNKDRLMSAWSKVDNNYLPRAKQGAKRLWIGTRWSIIDPAGIRQDILANSQHFKGYRWKSINIPALSERDISNFNYKYGVGFDTKYFRQRRASFERNGDIASWNAQYMGMPIERDQTVFSPDEMKYYNGTLPDGEPDKVFMVVDPAWGGGDYVAAPLCYQYEDEVYVADAVFNNGDKARTQPRIAKVAMDGGCTRMYIEGTKTTASYGEGVLEILKKNNYPINLKTSFKNAMGGAMSGKNKAERIYQSAPDIKQHFVFLAEGKRSKEYQMFMQNVFSFRIDGKSKHDDAPDSLQMALMFAYPRDVARSTILSRSRLGF